MRDTKPRVLRRLLRLRQLPFFEAVDLDELAMVAENLVERTIPAGAVVATAGSRVRDIALIIDGQIETSPSGPIYGPRQIHGALEVLGDRPAVYTTVASRDTQVLQLSGADFTDLLEDNFGLLVATLREVASRLVVWGTAFPQPTTAAPSDRLGLVERLLLLRQQLPFALARLPALAALAHASEEIDLTVGTVLVRAGDLATEAFVLIEGEALASGGKPNDLLLAGAPIGQLELLAGTHHARTIEATTPGRALRTTATALLDVLEDHTDVGLAILAALAKQLLGDGPSVPPA